MADNRYDTETLGFEIYEDVNYAYKRQVNEHTMIIVTNATPTDDWGFTIWNGAECTYGELNSEWAAACAARAALTWCGVAGYKKV